MSVPKDIRKFEYRPCRIATGFDVDFVTGEETFQGLCRDVSDSGIRVAFDESPPVGASGVLSLRHPNGTLEIEAQVGYVKEREVGFLFVFKTDWQRELTTEFIASIANISAVAPVVRFP